MTVKQLLKILNSLSPSSADLEVVVYEPDTDFPCEVAHAIVRFDRFVITTGNVSETAIYDTKT